jgi:hypothetical protein
MHINLDRLQPGHIRRQLNLQSLTPNFLLRLVEYMVLGICHQYLGGCFFIVEGGTEKTKLCLDSDVTVFLLLDVPEAEVAVVREASVHGWQGGGGDAEEGFYGVGVYLRLAVG